MLLEARRAPKGDGRSFDGGETALFGSNRQLVGGSVAWFRRQRLGCQPSGGGYKRCQSATGA